MALFIKLEIHKFDDASLSLAQRAPARGKSQDKDGLLGRLCRRWGRKGGIQRNVQASNEVP